MAFSKPSSGYLVELKQVADKADDLYSFLADQPNMLPIGFPSDAVMTLCAALRQLPDGSVEGSVPVLEAGLEQCPTVRRNYIPVEVGPDDPDYDPDSPPVFRGGELDALINDLFVAIGTAIDAFKDEYGPGFRDGIEIDPPVQAEPEFVLNAAINNARDAEIKIADVQTESFDLLREEEELQRGLVDADSELKVARSTASMPAPKPNLLSRLGSYISKTPEALRIAGKSVRALADVASPLAESAAKIFVSSWQSMLDAIALAGEGVEESGRRMAAWRDQKWHDENPASKENSVEATFDIELVQSRVLSGDALPDNWSPLVQELRLGSKGKRNWKDIDASAKIISKMTNLRYLDLTQTPFQDFTFLENLRELTELRLSATDISNLESVSTLRNLRVLHLNGCYFLSSIQGVEKLKNLTSLQVRVRHNLDYSPIFFLERLEILVLRDEGNLDDQLVELRSALPNVNINATTNKKKRIERKSLGI